MKRSILVRATVISALLMVVSFGALASFKASVLKTMKVYSQPTASDKYLLGSIEAGEDVTVLAYEDDWAKVKYSGKEGYAQIKFMKAKKRTKMYVISDSNIYKSATSSSERLGKVSVGDVVYKVGYSGIYMLVEDESGKKCGYVVKKNLSADAPNVKKETNVSKKIDNGTPEKTASYVIKVAKSFLGTPYEVKPDVPNTFNCSQFVKYCFGAAGIKLAGNARTQGYSKAYTKIESISDLKPGDIVCFDTEKDDSDLSDHTGIYLGGGAFIHASSSKKKVVKSSIKSYSNSFSWGLRVFE